MTEDELLKIGFRKYIVTKEESGNNKEFYYFYFNKGPVRMITNENDVANGDYKIFIEVENMEIEKDSRAFRLRKLIKFLNEKYEE